MNKFWQFVLMMLRYKRLLAAALIAALIDAACKAGGFGALVWVIKLFIEQNVTLHEIVEERIAAIRTAYDYDLTPLLQYVPKDPWWGLALTLGVILVLALIGSIARYLHEFWTITVALRTVARIRKAVFMRLVHLPLGVAASQRTAEMVSRVVRDSQVLARGFNALTGKTVSGVLGGLVLLAMAFWMDWGLTLMFLVVVPPIALMIRKFGKRIRRASKRALKQYGLMLGAISEALSALRVVKTHHAEGYERRRFNTINRRVLQQQLRARTARALGPPVIETLSLIGLVIVVLIAAWSVIGSEGRDTTTLVSVLVMLVGSGVSFRQLSGLNNSLQEAAAAAENIDEILHLPIELTASDQFERSRPILPRHRQSVAFDHVWYTYPQAQAPALRDVTLTVPHGSTCAIVGGNGSGKTTLLGLVPRLYAPDRGRVLVDGIDIAGCRLRSLRRQIALVTQDTVLFDGTVAQNIRYGSRHIGPDQVLAAARQAHAHDFICALPEGYDTQVGERGQRLSGGQRQRIAIARAILRDPAILILDEATSQIDTESEARIHAALAELTAGRTTFVIAHRLSTIVDADLIVVMDRASIVQAGRHADLLDSCDIYRQLWRAMDRGQPPVT